MNSKKNVHVSGTLPFPLKEGSRAAISCGGKMIYTSRVVEILEVSTDCVRFETMNSVYHVSLVPVPTWAPLTVNTARCA